MREQTGRFSTSASLPATTYLKDVGDLLHTERILSGTLRNRFFNVRKLRHKLKPLGGTKASEGIVGLVTGSDLPFLLQELNSIESKHSNFRSVKPI